MAQELATDTEEDKDDPFATSSDDFVEADDVDPEDLPLNKELKESNHVSIEIDPTHTQVKDEVITLMEEEKPLDSNESKTKQSTQEGQNNEPVKGVEKQEQEQEQERDENEGESDDEDQGDEDDEYSSRFIDRQASLAKQRNERAQRAARRWQTHQQPAKPTTTSTLRVMSHATSNKNTSSAVVASAPLSESADAPTVNPSESIPMKSDDAENRAASPLTQQVSGVMSLLLLWLNALWHSIRGFILVLLQFWWSDILSESNGYKKEMMEYSGKVVVCMEIIQQAVVRST